MQTINFKIKRIINEWIRVGECIEKLYLRQQDLFNKLKNLDFLF